MRAYVTDAERDDADPLWHPRVLRVATEGNAPTLSSAECAVVRAGIQEAGAAKVDEVVTSRHTPLARIMATMEPKNAKVLLEAAGYRVTGPFCPDCGGSGFVRVAPAEPNAATGSTRCPRGCTTMTYNGSPNSAPDLNLGTIRPPWASSQKSSVTGGFSHPL